MTHLLKAEIVRFSPLAIAFAVAHLAMLRLSMTLTPLFAQEAGKISVGLLSYFLLGAIFGLYQMRTYRQSHLWAWLVNRPLEPRQIFFALAGAAAALAGLVVVAPIFLMTIYTDFLSAQWVDGRHYLMMPFLFAVVMFAYFLGAFIATSPRRAAFLVAGLASFFITREAMGQWVFLPLTIAVAWLGYLAFGAFRPDLDAPEKRRLPLLATVLPVAYALFWLIVGGLALTRSLGIIFYEHGPTGLSTFAWNDYWDEGHLPHVNYQNESDTMAHGLRLGDSERAQLFLRQIDLADVYEPWGPRLTRYPRRHQPFFNDHRHELVDQENEVYWTFSHDHMLFSGRHLRTGQNAGWMGADGSVALSVGDLAAFPEVPYVIDSTWLVFPRQIFEIDFKRQRLDLRFEVHEPGEQIAMPFSVHRSFVVAMSNQRLYLFDPRRLELENGLLEPLTSYDLPGQDRNLERLQIAEMIDSYLVSFVYGAQSFRDFHPARQIVVELPIDSTSSSAAPAIIADVPLAAGFPDWFRRRGFILSPVLRHAHDLVWTAIGPQREERVSLGEILSRPVPTGIAAAAALLTALSLLITGWLLGRRRLAPSERRFWFLTTLVLGLPGMLACTLLTVREESAEVEAVEPSPRALTLGLQGQEST